MASIAAVISSTMGAVSVLRSSGLFKVNVATLSVIETVTRLMSPSFAYRGGLLRFGTNSAENIAYGGEMSTDVILYEVRDRIATITLNRPDKRNALSSEVLAKLPTYMQDADNDDAVDVIILTGTDPAFCAGLDLKELGDTAGNLSGTGADGSKNATGVRGPFPKLDKPLIGAVNGVAITGGFELALNCDFLIASEHAKFGDTHSRVGVMPGWGLTVLLPQAIGIRRAREMSFTGNFMDAHEALQFGLVNHVVPHNELMDFTRKIATDIIGNEQDGVRQIRSTYAHHAAEKKKWERESDDGREWRKSQFDPKKVEARRKKIMERGRGQ